MRALLVQQGVNEALQGMMFLREVTKKKDNFQVIEKVRREVYD